MNKAEILGLADRDRRTLSDPQRLLWRDDVEGICPTPGVCWEYGDTARCGPCAIKQAEKFGVESNHTIPNLPEVYRLRREARDQADEIARLRKRLEVVEDWSEDADGIACRNDTIRLQDERIARLREERRRLVEALKVADDAIKEMFRYYDGGETRGSYDGKPERAQLRKAGYATRAMIAALQHKEPQG